MNFQDDGYIYIDDVSQQYFLRLRNAGMDSWKMFVKYREQLQILKK